MTDKPLTEAGLVRVLTRMGVVTEKSLEKILDKKGYITETSLEKKGYITEKSLDERKLVNEETLDKKLKEQNQQIFEERTEFHHEIVQPQLDSLKKDIKKNRKLIMKNSDKIDRLEAHQKITAQDIRNLEVEFSLAPTERNLKNFNVSSKIENLPKISRILLLD